MSPRSVALSIADIVFSVSSDDPDLDMCISNDVHQFLTDPVEPHIALTARWENLARQTIDGSVTFDSGSVWRVYENEGEYIFSFTRDDDGKVPYKIARVNKTFTGGEVLLNRCAFSTENAVDPLEYPLDELIYTNYLTREKGIEVHACGVVDTAGRGHLFLGASGAGKTTVATLWGEKESITVLSDDRIVLRFEDDTVWMYGTPWHGEAELACPARAPLAKVYFLKQSIENRMLTISSAEAAARMMSCSFLPLYNAPAIDYALQFVENTVGRVPCCVFEFEKAATTIPYIAAHSQ